MSVGITVKMTNLLSVISVKVQLAPFAVNAIKKSKCCSNPKMGYIPRNFIHSTLSPSPSLVFFCYIFALNKHQVSNKWYPRKHCIYGHFH